MRKKTKIVSIVVILLFGLSALLVNLKKWLPQYLAESNKIDANLLIIEGWLPDVALEITKKEIRNDNYDFIVTTGIESSELDFCMVSMNGYLIFYPKFKSEGKDDNRHHVIEIVARSEMGGIYCSHFNFYLNDSLIADFNADEETRKYSIRYDGSLKGIDSLMVQFTNDMVDNKGDRNLYVKEIIIDNDKIIPYKFNSVYDIGLLGGNDRIVNNYESHPQIVRNKLISSGIDPLKITAVTGKRTNFNRTLESALAFRNWLKTNEQNVKAINIITYGVHARRTWLTYRRVLDKSYKIGIISIPETDLSGSGNLKEIKEIKEALDLIYYWIILIPYLVHL